VDVDECRSTATRFNVQAMPTFKLLHMGKEMASIQGANEAGLRELVAKVVAASGGGASNARGGGGGASAPAPAAAASAATPAPADPRSPRGGGGGSAIETGGVADPLADLD
jgi:thioredoxin-like negative regulator of GroEL